MSFKLQFPFFCKHKKYVYLDSAATTQVPETVINNLIQNLAFKSSIGRSQNKIVDIQELKYKNAVSEIAAFINAEPNELVFVNNSTDAVNVFVDALIDSFVAGDEIIVSDAEHNSNLLAFSRLLEKGCIIKVVKTSENGVCVDEFKSLLSSKTKLVALFHVSNVLGVINNINLLSKLIKDNNPKSLFLVDAAQSIAHLPIDVKRINCDALFFSAHKMYGPDGVGVLYINSKLHSLLRSVRIGGGTITDLELLDNSSELTFDLITPIKALMGGTINLVGILALAQAVNFIKSIGLAKIRAHETRLLNLLIEGLDKLDACRIIGPSDLNKRSGLVSFVIDGVDSLELLEYLKQKNFCIRYGSHCAFLLQKKLKQESIRVSFGIYNDEEDVNKLLFAINSYISKSKGIATNENFDFYKDMEFNSKDTVVKRVDEILRQVFSLIDDKQETEVVVMAGHFLAIPDAETNSFYPSIKGLLPSRMDSTLDEFGMREFPLETLEIGSKILKQLKKANVNSKMFVIANDTTGINEFKRAKTNVSEKAVNEYILEFLERFGTGDLPDVYLEVLKEHGLGLDDVIRFKDGNYFCRETILRSRFKDFITANKDYFNGLLNYGLDASGAFSLEIPILQTPDLKTCVFNTFNSKTGGKFCTVEVAELLGEIFGKADTINFKRISSMIKNPILKKKHRICIMLTPYMCNNAVNSAAELYYKLFHQQKADFDFSFINLGLGSKPKDNLRAGAHMYCLSSLDL